MMPLRELPVLLYVTDPMCPWCYAQTAVVRRLRALWQGRADVRILLGGMHPYATEPITRKQREGLAVLWHQVQEQTGLPFNYRFFLQHQYVFDTEPACRALLAVRLLRPNLALEVLRVFHTAFHADNLDLTSPRVLTQLVLPFGIEENLFLTLFESEEIQRQLDEEFRCVRDELGCDTFPSVYLRGSGQPQLLSKGFSSFTGLEQRLVQLLHNRNPEASFESSSRH